MFIISQFILSKLQISKDNIQTYSIISGLILYSSIYLYLLYTSQEFLTFYNNFIIYVVLIDLLLSGFMFYKSSKVSNKIDISNTDLVDFFELKSEKESSEEDYSEDESSIDELNELTEDDLNIEEIKEEINDNDIIEETDNNDTENIEEIKNNNILENFKLNFDNIDFNKIQQNLIDSGLNLDMHTFDHMDEINKINDIEEVHLSNETIENETNKINEQNENVKTEEINEIIENKETETSEKEIIKKKRGRKPKKTLTEQLSDPVILNKKIHSNIQISK